MFDTDKRSAVNDLGRTLLAGLEQATASAAAPPSDPLVALSQDISYVLNWVSITCFDIAPKLVPVPKGTGGMIS